MLVLHECPIENSPELSRRDLTAYANQLGLDPDTAHTLDGTADLRSQLHEINRCLEGARQSTLLTTALASLLTSHIDISRFLLLALLAGLKVERPGTGLVDFGAIRREIDNTIANRLSQSRSDKIKEGQAIAKRNGIKIGAPIGNRNRSEKLKEIDPNEVIRIRDLHKTMGVREIAAKLGISPATVSRRLRIRSG